MPYTDLPALASLVGESVLVQLTDRSDPPSGTIDAGVVDQAIARTDAVIDAALAVRYRLPLDAVPPAVADLAAVIALYKLHRYEPDAKVKTDYDRALDDLDDIASGKRRLPLAGIEPASSGAQGVIAIDRERDLTPESLRGFI